MGATRGINIIDIVSKHTLPRPEKGAAPINLPEVNSIDFIEKPVEVISQVADQIQNPNQTGIPPVEEHTIEAVQEKPHQNSEQSAEAVIDMINVLQKNMFTFFGARKIKKQIPEKVMKRFVELDMKDLMGEELSEDEQRSLKRYKEFEKRIDRFIESVPFTKDEREELLRATEALVIQTGMNIPPGVWFGVQVANILSTRAIGLATA